MNLFVSSPCVVECAQALDDARVINQIRETAQMLSTALFAAGLPSPYRPTHQHHPVNRWVQADARNFAWALRHMQALAHEHRFRFHASNWHASYTLHSYLFDYPHLLPSEAPDTFQNSARNQSLNLDFTHLEPTQAYRAYLNQRWRLALQASRAPRWTNRSCPNWATFRTP